jgi:endonuclease/exonuclease/phosphatase family metal-dependent hydrolase
MINIKQRESQDSIVYLSSQNTNNMVRETGQLRRAKMHVSYLIENVDNKSALTSNLRELLEASLTLQTTNTKILAAHLGRSPATIRTEFQQILTILGDKSKF